MSQPFSLLDHPWLPIATAGGQRTRIRPCDISRPDIASIATGRPDCDISLTEFLIGLLAVACPPKDAEAWRNGFSQVPTAEHLQSTLAPFAGAFVLDGDGPRFFQDREELQGGSTEVEALCMDVVAGHFTKPGRIKTLSRPGASIILATLQTSAPAGGAGHRTSLRGGGPLTTLVVPGGKPDQTHRLWRLLWANLPLAPDDKPVSDRVFPWLVPTRVSDKSGLSTTPLDVDPLQAYFGMPRRIRLVFEPNVDKRPCDLLGLVDDVIVTRYVTRPWGTNYEGWSRGHRLSPYYKAKPADTEYLPVHLKSSRFGYREWLGIAIGERNDTRIPAQSVDDFRKQLTGSKGDFVVVHRDARMLVAGYAMDNMKPLDFGETLMPLLVASTPGAQHLVRVSAKQAIDAAQETAGLLVSCVRTGLYGDGAKADGTSTVLQPIRDRFWAETEQDFFDTLKDGLEKAEALAEQGPEGMQSGADALTGQAAANWLAVLRRHAERIFDDSVPLDDADSRRIVDIVKARRQLLVALAGYGAAGKRIFQALGLPAPARPTKKEKSGNTQKVRAA